jgi:hypothetical protein
MKRGADTGGAGDYGGSKGVQSDPAVMIPEKKNLYATVKGLSQVTIQKSPASLSLVNYEFNTKQQPTTFLILCYSNKIV